MRWGEVGEEEDLNELVVREREEAEGVEPCAAERDDKDVGELQRFVCYDFECRQDDEIGTNPLGPVYKHVPNVCVVHMVCTSYTFPNICPAVTVVKTIVTNVYFRGPTHCKTFACGYLMSV